MAKARKKGIVASRQEGGQGSASTKTGPESWILGLGGAGLRRVGRSRDGRGSKQSATRQAEKEALREWIVASLG